MPEGKRRADVMQNKTLEKGFHNKERTELFTTNHLCDQNQPNLKIDSLWLW